MAHRTPSNPAVLAARSPGGSVWAPLTDPDTLVGTMGSAGLSTGWTSLDGGSIRGPQMAIEALDEKTWRVDLEIPGFHYEPIWSAGRRAGRVLLPGEHLLRRAGMPEVPILAANLPIPAGADLEVKVVRHEVAEFSTAPVVPSLGHLERDRDPATAPVVFSDFYASGGVWPPGPYVLGESFRLRDQSGVNLRLQPVRYDAGSGKLLVSRILRLEITARGGSPTKSIGASTSSEFSQVYAEAFAAQAPSANEKYAPLPTRGRLLLVSNPAFIDDLEPLLEWKRRLGIDAQVASTAQTGTTAEEITNYLRGKFQEAAGLTWVILVGDHAAIPPHVGRYDGSDSDSRYALLAGDDEYPDIYVSRIPAQTSQQVATQVSKFIAYEKFNDGGDGKWLRRAVGIGSDEGVPADFERLENLRADLLDYGFDTVDRQYQSLGGSRTGIRTAVEEGCSLINYLGHGTGTSWVSVPFTNLDVARLANGSRWPWVVDVSCSNGDFSLDPCFAESWMQAGTPNQPLGAIAVVSATSPTPWVPPTVMQTEIVELLVQERATSIGSLYYGGLMKVLDLYSGLPVATRVMEQNVVFGDCSLQVRTAPPGIFEILDTSTLPAGASNWTLKIAAAGQEVAGARVALTGGGILYGSGQADSSGQVAVVLASSPATGQDLDVTISGFNMIPYLGIVEVGSNGVAPVETEPETNGTPPATVRLLGNRPNPFNPTTRIEFELPASTRVRLGIYDIRGRRIAQLMDGNLPAGRHQVVWNARDAVGREVASGVYLYRLQTQQGSFTGRMTLAK